jgi:hypothetical protein
VDQARRGRVAGQIQVGQEQISAPLSIEHASPLEQSELAQSQAKGLEASAHWFGTHLKSEV